jgi:hypothetical protein
MRPTRLLVTISLLAGWRTASWLVLILLGLGVTACGEITAFCLSAGAPDGVTLEVTVTPTRNGNRITCGPARPDSSQRARQP